MFKAQGQDEFRKLHYTIEKAIFEDAKGFTVTCYKDEEIQESAFFNTKLQAFEYGENFLEFYNGEINR